MRNRGKQTVDTGISERLQKILARSTSLSRRRIEDEIVAQRVVVNGSPAILGDKVSLTDTVTIGGRPVRLVPPVSRPSVLAYYKPEGVICSRRKTVRDDDLGNKSAIPTAYDILPKVSPNRPQWNMVGRLDLNSCGLLLFTNWGDLAAKLMHPSSELEREYMVRIHPQPSVEKLQKLCEGVKLEDGLARFLDLVPGPVKSESDANRWYCVTLQEGRNRIVRRLFESIGCSVSRLIRVRYGPVFLPREKKRGQKWYLDNSEIEALCKLVGLEHPSASVGATNQRQALRRLDNKRGGAKNHRTPRARFDSKFPQRKK